jgi:hypothetical protein
MNKHVCLLAFCLIVLTGPGYGNTISVSRAERSVAEAHDTIDRQILYNGRVWRNNFMNIDGNQFLFSNDFLPGSVTMDGKTFNGKNLKLKYNIYDDELLTVTSTGTVLQLNSEMVDDFTLKFEDRLYLFRNLQKDSLNKLDGYVQVVYGGATPLFLRYNKEIRLRSSVGENDTFLQTYRIYVLKDGILHKLTNKKNLKKILSDRKEEMKNFFRSNHNHISKSVPESYAPALKFYDSLR